MYLDQEAALLSEKKKIENTRKTNKQKKKHWKKSENLIIKQKY